MNNRALSKLLRISVWLKYEQSSFAARSLLNLPAVYRAFQCRDG
jgi:hypothetical protein